MIGGFNFGGVPYTLVEALEKAGTNGLTMISNDTSYADVGHGRLVAAGQIKRSSPRISASTRRPVSSTTPARSNWNSFLRELSSSASAPAASVWADS